jgi:hypothetical protein
MVLVAERLKESETGIIGTAPDPGKTRRLEVNQNDEVTSNRDRRADVACDGWSPLCARCFSSMADIPGVPGRFSPSYIRLNEYPQEVAFF